MSALIWVRTGLAGGFVPAAFIFGDSLVDAGNNNYISTLSRANYLPNGIDFGKATGRFTNGRTHETDLSINFYILSLLFSLEQELGYRNFTPPYLAATKAGAVAPYGVNYASGAGGILNETGQNFGGRINLDAQIENFKNTRQDMISSVGAPAAMKLLERALFSVTVGTNDLLNNYLPPIGSTARQRLLPPETFVGTMISRFRLQLLRLYRLGARKIVVANLGLIGCIPFQRDSNPSSGLSCVDFANELAQLFNIQLRSLVAELNTSLKGSQFVYADVYHIVEDILQNYKSYGFENANSSCCSIAGRFGGLVPCLPSSRVCSDRSKFVFWDAYHPTEAANIIIAKRLMDGDLDDISPVNIRHLVDS
ncbi:hypothetical protein RJ640_014678 [Escallonia rubra]|uniref:GDSL esterase/lipase n=1 Tax=Escallonia rubra TaxID=112253 RepID=A0AA88UQ44_9ASTE|nr:hypothetical protein RJ640_014678 [Escallonia rubra]